MPVIVKQHAATDTNGLGAQDIMFNTSITNEVVLTSILMSSLEPSDRVALYGEVHWRDRLQVSGNSYARYVFTIRRVMLSAGSPLPTTPAGTIIAQTMDTAAINGPAGAEVDLSTSLGTEELITQSMTNVVYQLTMRVDLSVNAIVTLPAAIGSPGRLLLRGTQYGPNQ